MNKKNKKNDFHCKSLSSPQGEGDERVCGLVRWKRAWQGKGGATASEGYGWQGEGGMEAGRKGSKVENGEAPAR